VAKRRGNVLPFRWKRRRWTRTDDYWFGSPPPKPPKKSWGQAWSETRPFVLLIALVTIWYIGDEHQLIPTPGFLLTEAETVSGHFTRCGPGRGENCVVDGDTFKIGRRDIRVVGIDTPEVDARCSEEAAGAERATLALRDWLNSGPFQMTAKTYDQTDRYGREVRIVSRAYPNTGEVRRLADYMIDGGYARRYIMGYRAGWC
jgi:endonuclease YncB( thermonuclease family)